MPRMPEDPILFAQLSTFIEVRGQKRSAAAKELGVDRDLIYRVLRNRGAVIPATKHKLLQALDAVEGAPERQSSETQQTPHLTEPLSRLALRVAQFIADAVGQQVAPLGERESR
jgi:hypothetical protein